MKDMERLPKRQAIHHHNIVLVFQIWIVRYECLKSHYKNKKMKHNLVVTMKNNIVEMHNIKGKVIKIIKIQNIL